MRIVCIAASFVPSTAANSIQVMKVCDALAGLGHAVTLIVPGDQQIPWDELKGHYGVQASFNIQWVRENLTFKRYDYSLKAVRLARKLKPDMLYTWVLQAAVLGLWMKIPTLLEMHDRITGKFGPWLFRQFWKSKTPGRVLAITGALKRAVISSFDGFVQPDQIFVGPDGVDLKRYQPPRKPEDARRQLGLEQGLTVGYTGHFYAGRGIELMYSLGKALPAIKFLWVGGDPADVEHWKKRIASDKIQNITLTGFVENQRLPTYQFACDILLMPYGASIAGSGGGNTADIASPMKMFEYMAAGRAIISSDLPVIHEVLDEDTALFCPSDDLSAWKAAIVKLTDDSALRESLGRAARSKVTAYTWQERQMRALAGFGSEGS
jgi:glycosyltransferase involved in cell wall biosynthesis